MGEIQKCPEYHKMYFRMWDPQICRQNSLIITPKFSPAQFCHIQSWSKKLLHYISRLTSSAYIFKTPEPISMILAHFSAFLF